jgi:hypothetical protein
MTSHERREERKFATWCREMWMERKLRGWKLKDDSNRGFPDRTVVLAGGQMLAIEFKGPDGELDPWQKREIERLQEMDVPVLVTTTCEEAVQWVQQFLPQ